MSGTSLDGIDVALVNLEKENVRLIDFYYLGFSEELQKRLHEISKPNALISLQMLGKIDCEVGLLFAKAVNKLLEKSTISKHNILAIGSHGQTIYHSPNSHFPFTLQIGDPNIIAQKTGITTVADFRRRDIAAGGQGAPLVPAFHEIMFSHDDENRCILNIGGIANVTFLPAKNTQKPILGFDTGMGNTLMNQWIKLHLGKSYDEGGAWAKTGKIDFALVEKLKSDDYFLLKPPKSTGVDYFSLDWLKTHLEPHHKPENVQASLCYLTALTICEAIKNYAPNTHRILLCGGGSHNACLIDLIKENINCTVQSTDEYGIHPDHVEAIAFAWLAKQTLHKKSGNVKNITGAKDSVILGGVYF